MKLAFPRRLAERRPRTRGHLALLVFAIVAGTIASRVHAQGETTEERAATQKSDGDPPAASLDPFVADDFRADTRANYKIAGDVSWQRGQLALGRGASLLKAIDSSPWVTFNVQVQFESSKDTEAEFEIRLGLDRGTECFVRYARKVVQEKLTHSLALFETDSDGDSRAVRELPLPDTPARIELSYRHGLLRVGADSVIVHGFIGNGAASVDSITCRGPCVLRSCTGARLTLPKVKRSAEQQAMLKAVRTDKREMMKLYRTGGFSQATVVAERLLKAAASLYGTETPAYASALNDLGIMHYQTGAWAEAESCYQKAAAIREATLGPLHPAYATTISSLSTLYLTGREYAKAEPLARQALAIHKTVLGTSDSLYATKLNNLASLYYQMDEIERAAPLFADAAEIRRTVLGDRHPDYAASLNALAALADRRGAYEEAARLFQECIGIWKATIGEKHPHYATSLSNLGVLFKQIGDFSRAEPLLAQACAIKKAALGEAHPSYLWSVKELAEMYQKQGRFAEAKQTFGELASLARANPGAAPAYRAAITGLAMVHLTLDDIPTATPLLEESMSLWQAEAGADSLSYANSLNNLAAAYLRTGDYSKARPLYEQCVKIIGNSVGLTDAAYARALESRALVYMRQNELHLAEEDLQDAGAIWVSLGQKDSESYAGVANKLGTLSRLKRNYDQSVTYHKEAEKIRRRVLGVDDDEYAITLNDLGLALLGSGEIELAKRHLKDALRVWQDTLGKDHQFCARALGNLGAAHHSHGDTRTARDLYEDSVAIQRRVLERNGVAQSERQQRRNQDAAREYLDHWISCCVDDGTGRAAGVIEKLWTWKGSVSSRQRAYRTVASTPELRPMFEELKGVSLELSVAAASSPLSSSARKEGDRNGDRTRLEIWRRRIQTLMERRESLERELAKKSKLLLALSQPPTIEAVRSVLPGAHALIDVFAYEHATPRPEAAGQFDHEPRYAVSVVRPDRAPVFISLRHAAEIDELIEAFRRPFIGKSDLREVGTAAEELRQKLWLPLEQHLDGVQTVIVSPDTALGTLPWAALPGREEGRYLIEEYRFATLSFAGLLESMSDPQPKTHQPPKGLLIVGDVNYDASASVPVRSPEPKPDSPWVRRSPPRTGDGRWRSLPGFSDELAVVQREFLKKFGSASVTVLDGDSATEAEFIREASQHYNVHVATHGFFADPRFAAIGARNGAEPEVRLSPTERLASNETIDEFLPGLLSGIVLAGANAADPDKDPMADGILTAAEIETLDLNGVDLVVLSACETGLGKTAGGEGLTGLQRSLHIAGVRSCVATLWDVDDRATKELMSRFYRYYWGKGWSKIDSLRQAQLDLLDDRELARGIGGVVGEPRERHPVVVDRDGAARRTDPRYWAAFVLSGDWQ